MTNKCIKVKSKTCKEFNSEKNCVNKVNKNQQKFQFWLKTIQYVFRYNTVTKILTFMKPADKVTISPT